MTRPLHSHLQNRILFQIAKSKNGVKSLAGLARQIEAHRSSVSRSIHALQNDGLVVKNEKIWVLTDEGQKEVLSIRTQAANRANIAAKDLARFSVLSDKASSPFLEMIRKIGDQQVAFMKAANFQLIQSINENYQTPLHNITNQQAALFTDILKKTAFLKEYESSVSTLMLNSSRLAALVDSMNTPLFTQKLLDTQALIDMVKVFETPTISEILAQAGEAYFKPAVYSRLLQEAAAFVSANQFVNVWTLNLPDLSTLYSRELGESSVMLSRMVTTINKLNSAPINDILRKFAFHITEVTRTQFGNYLDAVSNIKAHAEYRISKPYRVTADYLETSVDIGLYTDNEYWSTRTDISIRVISALRIISPHLSVMWEGAWEAAMSDNPDYLHQAAHSGRELLMQTLAWLAPDDGFTKEDIEQNGENGRITRRMRVAKIFAKRQSSRNWANAMIEALLVTSDTLTDISHYRTTEPPVRRHEIMGMLITLGGLLLACIDVQNESR